MQVFLLTVILCEVAEDYWDYGVRYIVVINVVIV